MIKVANLRSRKIEWNFERSYAMRAADVSTIRTLLVGVASGSLLTIGIPVLCIVAVEKVNYWIVVPITMLTLGATVLLCVKAWVDSGTVIFDGEQITQKLPWMKERTLRWSEVSSVSDWPSWAVTIIRGRSQRTTLYVSRGYTNVLLFEQLLEEKFGTEVLLAAITPRKILAATLPHEYLVFRIIWVVLLAVAIEVIYLIVGIRSPGLAVMGSGLAVGTLFIGLVVPNRIRVTDDGIEYRGMFKPIRRFCPFQEVVAVTYGRHSFQSYAENCILLYQRGERLPIQIALSSVKRAQLAVSVIRALAEYCKRTGTDWESFICQEICIFIEMAMINPDEAQTNEAEISGQQ